ncbi:MAG: DNA-binding protein [Methanothrix sp.]|nr:DNA-binding protein [Methanothrix sp.]
MGCKRFRDQILCKILHVCWVGANKTQIVYSSNMNFHTVVPYLNLLIRNGLAERVEGERPRYRTTPKGAEVLQHFEEIEKLMPEMEALEEPA